MKRTVTIEIAGGKYPLLYNGNAIEWVENTFGNQQDMINAMLEGSKSPTGALLDVMAKLLEQGAAFENCKRFSNSNEDYVRNEAGDVETLSRDELGLIFDSDDYGLFTKKIIEAMELANKREIEGTETPEAKKSKKK